MAYYFHDDLKNEIITANDIVDVVSEYVQIKRTGRNYSGLCPFHNEKSPSFITSPDKQLYKCFGCGVGGNVVDFIMRIEHLDFQEAMLHLAERVHIKVEEQTGNGKNYSTDKEKVFNINTEAARFFNKTLHESEAALDYINNRGLSENTCTKFGLGFAPDSWHSLLDHLKLLGFEESDIYKSGLISKKNEHYYDSFRNRIIFPIIDLRGRVVGFGGRVMDDSKPKYLNSPETPVFDKSRNFYGLNFAKSSDNKTVVIVEGYMDVIALHQAGIPNAIATLGTAFTDEHAKILNRYFDDVVLAFDSDDAGRKATDRCISILSRIEDIKIRVLSQTQAKDPDEYIKKFGMDAFVALIDNAPMQVEYRILRLKEGFSFTNVEDKIRFISAASEIFTEISSDVEREIYVKKIARDYDVSEEAIFSEIYKKTGRQKRAVTSYDRKQVVAVAAASEKAEMMLLSLVYDDKELYNSVRKIIGGKNFFSNKVYGEIFELIKTHGDLSLIFDTLTDEQKSAVSEISVRDYHISDARTCAVELIEKISEGRQQKMICDNNSSDAEMLKNLISTDKRSKKGNS